MRPAAQSAWLPSVPASPYLFSVNPKGRPRSDSLSDKKKVMSLQESPGSSDKIVASSGNGRPASSNCQTGKRQCPDSSCQATNLRAWRHRATVWRVIFRSLATCSSEHDPPSSFSISLRTRTPRSSARAIAASFDAIIEISRVQLLPEMPMTLRRSGYEIGICPPRARTGRESQRSAINLLPKVCVAEASRSSIVSRGSPS